MTSEELARTRVPTNSEEWIETPENREEYVRRHTVDSHTEEVGGDDAPSTSGSPAQPPALARDVEGILRTHLYGWGQKLVQLQPKVLMSDHLVECGMHLFKYLRQLQVEAAYDGRFPLDYLSNEQLLIHDLIACFWIGLKHCSVRTAVPNRTLLCRATGANAELLNDRELAALIAMDWSVSAVLRSAGLVV
eukprot:scaffold7.g3478.t1